MYVTALLALAGVHGALITETDASMRQMGEMSAIRMFMKMRAFDKIPMEGSISYKDLADSLNAEEALVSTLTMSIAIQAARPP